MAVQRSLSARLRSFRGGIFGDKMLLPRVTPGFRETYIPLQVGKGTAGLPPVVTLPCVLCAQAGRVIATCTSPFPLLLELAGNDRWRLFPTYFTRLSVFPVLMRFLTFQLMPFAALCPPSLTSGPRDLKRACINYLLKDRSSSWKADGDPQVSSVE